MTTWFLDASVLLAAEDGDDAHHRAARDLLTSDAATLATLDLAYYEVGNVAIRAWGDAPAAARLRRLVAAIAADGGLVRVDEPLSAQAAQIADTEGLSVYDAGYVAGAARAGARLVSCDVRDLVDRGHAVRPEQACRPA